MKKMFLIMAMAALACWLPGQALADLTYQSTAKTILSDTLPSEASYGTVVVNLLTATTATVTITPTESPVDFDFINASNVYPAEINVNGSFSATASSSTGAATIYAGPVTFDSTLGTFNLGAYMAGGSYPESYTFHLTATGGNSWAQASDVLVGNAKGFDAVAGLIYIPNNSQQGYVAEVALDPPSVPLPPTALMLGSGLLGLVGWRRFKKS